MRAARYYGKGDIRIEEIPEPAVGPGQIKIAPAFVGICGTDLHEYLGGPTFCPTTPHPITHDTIPVTFGHEFSGRIKEIGPGVQGNYKIGQACAIRPTLFCGRCAACGGGSENVCPSGGFLGLSGGGGGLSEAVCVDAEHVFPIPSHITLEEAALVEPLSTSWHAVSAAANEISPDSVVLIFGGGPIGLATVLCLKGKGVKEIIVSEVAAARQDFARQFGATRVIDPTKNDVTKVVLELTNGKGADVVFDCAGVPSTIKGSCDAVRTKGTIVNVAIWEKEIAFNPNWITWKESCYKSVLGYQDIDFNAVIDKMATGAIKPGCMVTRRIKLENVVKDGIEALINDKENHVKILINMDNNMTSSHRILVLAFEEPPDVIRKEYGTYGDILVRFVFGDAKPNPEVEIKKHQVLESYEYPQLSETSAIMIAGSKYSAFENDPWVPSLLDYIKQAYRAEIPVAGFCYGHQIIARALGGQVTLNPGGYELGMQEVTLSSQGVDILGTETLKIPQFHRDCVSSLPPNLDNLASSSQCEVQVMYQKSRVLGYQGHPEFDSFAVQCLADYLLEQGFISQELFDSQVQRGDQERGATVMSKLMREFLLGLD
ncbi:hypothetical protein BHE90_004689 [Fusarium euwallaceae]|uniref:Enoyl reductase (ER) domain-containing protein n=1 Tax=Fusarium euwallaceae TaxID=1147111 RepID=A0A430LYI0_9HYPO|nr:hypothetical protein BHE90_004689 [Fusarium euwallaceae]